MCASVVCTGQCCPPPRAAHQAAHPGVSITPVPVAPPVAAVSTAAGIVISAMLASTRNNANVEPVGAWQHNPYSLISCFEKAQHFDFTSLLQEPLSPTTPSSRTSSSSALTTITTMSCGSSGVPSGVGAQTMGMGGPSCGGASGDDCSLSDSSDGNAAFEASRGGLYTHTWVRITGLTYSTCANKIWNLCSGFGLEFAPCDNEPVNLLLFSGRPSGRAVLHMRSEQEAARAVEILSGCEIDGRYLECQQITLDALLGELQRIARRLASRQGADGRLPVGVDANMRDPRPFVPASLTGCCLKLVGLPMGTAEDDVLAFLQPYRVRTDGVHFETRCGKTVGSCVVVMADGLEALRAVQSKHKQFIGRRYIEVYPARPCDLFCDVAELKHVVRLEINMPSSTDNRTLWEHMSTLLDGLPVTSVESCTLSIGTSNAHRARNPATQSAQSEATLASPATAIIAFVSLLTPAAARHAVRRCVEIWGQKQTPNNAQSPSTTPLLCGERPRVCTLCERNATLRKWGNVTVSTANANY